MSLEKAKKDDLLKEVQRLQRVVSKLQKARTEEKPKDSLTESAKKVHQQTMDKLQTALERLGGA